MLLVINVFMKNIYSEIKYNKYICIIKIKEDICEFAEYSRQCAYYLIIIINII